MGRVVALNGGSTPHAAASGDGASSSGAEARSGAARETGRDGGDRDDTMSKKRRGGGGGGGAPATGTVDHGTGGGKNEDEFTLLALAGELLEVPRTGYGSYVIIPSAEECVRGGGGGG